MSLACDGRIFFLHLILFLLRETNLSFTFTKCQWFVPWVRLYWQQFGEHIASTRNSPPIASIETITSKASVNHNAKDQEEKKDPFLCSIFARDFFQFLLEQDGFEIDVWINQWNFGQRILVWCDRSQNLKKREIIADIWHLKNGKYLNSL